MRFTCIVCNHRKSQIISQKTRDSNSRVVKCSSCLHIQLYPLPSTKEDKNFYNLDLQAKNVFKKINSLDLEKRSAVDTQRRVEFIHTEFKNNRSVLDVGSGYGFFIKAIGDVGFQATGLEVSSARREISKTITNVPLLSKAITGPNKTKNRYDIITLFHVLEHIKDPIKLCVDLKSYLKKDGTLIVEVPNANHYMLKVSKSYRDFFWQRAHISYFKTKILKQILKNSGYQKINVLGVQRYSFLNALHWLLFRRPQLENPIYDAPYYFLWLEKIYKNYLEANLISDTLCVEAKP